MFRWSCLVLFAAVALSAAELQPSFPNYAEVEPPVVAPRGGPDPVPDTDIPFSWPQTIVTRESSAVIRFIRGFDPQLQPVQFNIIPSIPQYIRIEEFHGENGLLGATVLGKTADKKEVLQFRVTGHGVTSTDVYDLTFDIRPLNSRVRGSPLLSRSIGDFVKPGNIVRFAWTKTSGEKFPKCEAELFGKTGQARGSYSSTITRVLATKASPRVLGHYLMTVTPRDVRGEPPRGSTSNGVVFRCVFGSENLPPVADGIFSDTFTPSIGQEITVRPNVVDPETGQSTFTNAVFNFGDGTGDQTSETGTLTHAYERKGIYRVRITVTDIGGLTTTAEDSIVVGATAIEKLPFEFRKQIIPEEGGIGIKNADNLSVSFKDVDAQAGDRIIFLYNRNQFGRAFESDGTDSDIVLKSNGGFSGKTNIAKNVTVGSSGSNLSFIATGAQFDRTGDPRFGRAENKGIFRKQRIALAILRGSEEPRVYLYSGNMDVKCRGGRTNRFFFDPEKLIEGKTTLKEPDPKKQEEY